MLDAQPQSAQTPGSDQPLLQRFLCEREVIALLGFGSRSAFRKEVAEGRFPAPVRISKGRVAWIEREIAQWQSARMAARDARS